MDISRLPKPGINFRTAAGPSSFKKKLAGITRHGSLAHLRDNQEAIVETVKKFEGAIRTGGGLSRMRRTAAISDLKAADKNLTKSDLAEAKKIFEYLGKGVKSDDPKGEAITYKGIKLFKTKDSKIFLTAGGEKMIKTSDGKNFLSEAQMKRNLMLNMERDESGLRNLRGHGAQYTSGSLGSKTVGVMSNQKTSTVISGKGATYGVGKKSSLTQNDGQSSAPGFISGYREKKAGSPPSSNSLPPGERPIGL